MLVTGHNRRARPLCSFPFVADMLSYAQGQREWLGMGANNDYDIQDEQGYQQALSTLSQAAQPPAILRLLMRAFEAYRAARKMGWSRPWNKYDLINFQSFRLQPQHDGPLIDLAHRLLRQEAGPLPAEVEGYVADLLADEGLMGFVFCHEYREDGRIWEGATLSLGRKVQRRYRDRLDIILESEIRDGKSRGLGRLRVYVDPYTPGRTAPLWQTQKEQELGELSRALFAELSDASWTWMDQADRIWDHWTSRYIDYFGERQQPLRHSYFYLPRHADGRLGSETHADLTV
jgi:hypothetical protein